MVSTLAPRLVHGVANSHLGVETLAHWMRLAHSDYGKDYLHTYIYNSEA